MLDDIYLEVAIQINKKLYDENVITYRTYNMVQNKLLKRVMSNGYL